MYIYIYIYRPASSEHVSVGPQLAKSWVFNFLVVFWSTLAKFVTIIRICSNFHILGNTRPNFKDSTNKLKIDLPDLNAFPRFGRISVVEISDFAHARPKRQSWGFQSSKSIGVL